ncbi:MAG: hypothetical protein MUF00_01785 [Gemmatimonadaceae bacterium]|nr:hypothetical protein [Gemmatimonadaceae bacterium]
MSVAAGGPPLTVQVSVARGSGTAPVELTVSAIPPGVTAVITPRTLEGAIDQAQLTITALPTAIPGNTTLTVIGTSNRLTVAATLPLTVTARADFALSADSARLTVPVFASAQSVLRVTRQNGFAAPVALSAVAPPGVTVRLSADTLRDAVATTTLTVSTASTIAPGTYTVQLVARGAGVDDKTLSIPLIVPPLAGALTLRVTPTSLIVQRGRSAVVRLAVQRAAPFAGPVTIAVDDSTDRRVQFTPAVIAPGDSTATVEVRVATDALLGAATRTLRALGVGAAPGSAPLSLTVIAAESGILPIFNNLEPVRVAAGTAIRVPVVFQRPLQNGSGPLTLSALINAGSGIVIRFVPSVITGDSTTAEISVPAATTPATYAAAFRVNVGGFVDAQPSVPIVVLPRTGRSAEIRFCDPQNFPSFFAVQDSGAPWRPIQRTGGSYVFDVTSDRVGVVLVRRASATSTNTFVRARFVTRAELADLANVECETLFSGNRRLTVSISGISALEGGLISFAPGFDETRTFYSTAFAPPGPLTVRLSRFGEDASGRLLRDVIVRRGLSELQTNPMAPVAFGSAEAIAAQAMVATATNLATDSVYWTSGLHAPGVTRFLPGTFAGLYYVGPGRASRDTRHFAIGSAAMPDDELQDVTATAYAGPGAQLFRHSSIIFREPGDRTVTFAAVAPPFAWSLVGDADALRPRATGQLPGVEQGAVGAAIRQPVTTLSAIIFDLTVSRAWMTRAGFEVEFPDLRGIPGWDPVWALRRGVAASTFEDAYTTSAATLWAPLQDGARYARNSRVQNIVP